MLIHRPCGEDIFQIENIPITAVAAQAATTPTICCVLSIVYDLQFGTNKFIKIIIMNEINNR